MRWTPTKIPRSSPSTEEFAGSLPGRHLRSGLLTVSWAASVIVMIAGLAWVSIAGAQEVTGSRAVETASSWPWIAAAAILTLLVTVSFVSRRRMYTVVGH